jgi:hypothetical protein
MGACPYNMGARESNAFPQQTAWHPRRPASCSRLQDHRFIEKPDLADSKLSLYLLKSARYGLAHPVPSAQPRSFGKPKRRNTMRYQKVFVFVVSFIFLLTLGLQRVAAQTNTGSISGTVRDSTGAVVPDAKVTARNISTGVERTAQTDGTGGYTFPGLLPAAYEVTISKSGFSDYKARAEVTVGSFVTVSAQLSLSNVTSEIEVVVAAGTEINTQSQEVSQIITPEQVANLPSLTRNPYDFIALSGNVSSGDRGLSNGNPQLAGGGQNGFDRGLGFNINGQRASGTEILLDGAENSNIFDTTVGILIPQDAMQEFRVITNNFDAQYGRASGGIVNVVTKSGTNTFHGGAWEYNRLSAYTANTSDNNANGFAKGHYTRNQFGYEVGGPAIKDKLFFYQSTEWLRVRSAASVGTYVPTPEFIALTAPSVVDFFSKFANQNFTFASTLAKTTVGGVPHVGSISGTAGGPFSAVPDGTPIFGLVNYTAPVDAGGDGPQNTYLLVGRADYNFTDKTQLFFRFAREALFGFPGSTSGGSTPYAQYDVGQTIYNNNFLLSATHTFTSNLLSNTRLSFFRVATAQQFNTALVDTPTLFLYNNASVSGQPINLPGFFPSTTGSGGLPYGGPFNSAQINQDVSWIKGKHTMKFGGELNYFQLNRGFGAYAQANEQLGKSGGAGLDNMMTGTLTNFQKAVNPAGHFPCFAGSYHGASRGSLIVTPLCTVTPPLTEPDFTRSNRNIEWALYAEDTWRFTPKLSLNYGLRYDHFGVQHNSNSKLDSNLYYGSGTSIFEQIHNGSIQLAPNSPVGGLWNPSWGTVGPRLGFAYDVFGNGKTSIRGGYGITYERNFGNVTFNIIQNPPNNATVSVSNTVVSVSNLGPLSSSGGAGIPLPPVSPRNVDQNIKTAQTQFWGVMLEHKLGSKSVVALEYNGAHGIHLYDIKNINEIGGGQVYLGQALVTSDPNNANCTVASPCFTRPNQQFTSINNRGSGGYSHYNGITARFQTQEWRNTGLSVLSNYTWSHSQDNISSTFSESSSSSNGVGNLGYLDPSHPKLDYGNSDFDVRHHFSLAVIWHEPYFKNSKGFLGQAAGGWSLEPLFTARSGSAFSIADSSNCLNCQTGPYGIPRYVPSSAISSFNTGAATQNLDSKGNPIPNSFTILTLPAANSFTGLLGFSDFGPYPSNMTMRNAFYGPGAWNFDLAMTKSFTVTERVKLEFRAEGFNIFNHSNMYYNGFGADVGLIGGGAITIEGKKGGLGQLANNGQHDERRFGQFALRVMF